MCVDENNDGGDVVEREQKHADRLDDARRVAASSRKHVSVATAALFARIIPLQHTTITTTTTTTTITALCSGI